MKLTTRETFDFVEIKVDEIGTTIFKGSDVELIDTIENLLLAANSLCSYTKFSIEDFIDEDGQINF